MSDVTYAETDFVYVDPDARAVVGPVEWDKDGNALPKEWPRKEREPKEGAEEDDKRFRRKPRVRYYPWGAYKTMAKIYRLEGKGKERELERYIPLEDAITKLQEDPYWN